MNILLLPVTVTLILSVGAELLAVELRSTLNDDQLVCSGKLLIFTCTTRGSPILEWFSEEYIGTGGDRLQILSGSDRNTSSINPDVVATRINVTNDNGITVIVSELQIIASIKYPTATVSCSNGNLRSIQNITFRMFAVTLNSTLNAEHVARPQGTIIFTCITRGSPILEWFSEEYIGTGGDRLQVLSGSDRNTSSITPDAIATRISVTTENGIVIIVSELRIIASIRFPEATVSCSNGSPKKNNVTFRTVERGINENTTRVTIIASRSDGNDQQFGAIGAVFIAITILIAIAAMVFLLVIILKVLCKPMSGSVLIESDKK